MVDLWRQGIDVSDKNELPPENIYVPKNIPLPQLEEENSSIPEGIICPSRSKHLHNTYAVSKNCSCEEVMKMKKLEMFLILFPVD